MANNSYHPAGKDSPCYKTGIGSFIKLSRVIREFQHNCSRCGKDLSNATRYEWALHHKDHDRTHNTPDNFELLCKRCHQLEHDCISKLKLTYTKTCDICGCVFESKANNAKYCPDCRVLYQKTKKNTQAVAKLRAMIQAEKV